MWVTGWVDLQGFIKPQYNTVIACSDPAELIQKMKEFNRKCMTVTTWINTDLTMWIAMISCSCWKNIELSTAAGCCLNVKHHPNILNTERYLAACGHCAPTL